MGKSFIAPWWLKSPHLQTLFPTFFRQPVSLPLHRERLVTPDSDFIDIAYPDDNGGALVFIFHGLEGSLQSHYARGMMKALYDAGMFPVFMHFRGCNGETNQTVRRYHSCETSDPKLLLDTFRERYPHRACFAVGFSLGGNMLLKWLSELNESSPFDKTVAISVPFDLSICDQRLQQGLSRIYLRHLLNKLRVAIKLKHDAGLFPLDYEKVMNSKTFREFDEHATAPMHGFQGADDYYATCSSKFYLHTISTPTLVIQSRDDPFLIPEALPGKERLPACIEMALSDTGGHVGFITGNNPFKPRYWAEEKTVRYLLGQ
ncbi:MAG: hydrolase [Thioalkalispiraceae bacterium]|jgi:predicted alpha/beta-fold hydrolase